MMKLAFKIIYYIFIAFVAAIAILLIVSVFPIPGNYKVLTVFSGSMEPKIKTGSIVTVRPANDYKVNEIITFNKEGNLVTHRIIDIEEVKEKGNTIFYTVKGDANEEADAEKVPRENVIGKVLFSIPFLGYTLDFAKKPVGFLLLIWVPAIIIIWEETGKIRKELKKSPKITAIQTIQTVETSPKVNLDIKQKEEKPKNKKSRSGKTIKKTRELSKTKKESKKLQK